MCMSYDMTWEYLHRLIAEMNAEGKIKSGHWIWAFDNFNVHHRVKHEREGQYINTYVV